VKPPPIPTALAPGASTQDGKEEAELAEVKRQRKDTKAMHRMDLKESFIAPDLMDLRIEGG
jgi:hypothetical protein